MADEPTKQNEESPPAKKKSGRFKWILIAAGLLVVVGGGVGGYLMMKGRGEAASPEAQSVEDELASDAAGHGKEVAAAEGEAAAGGESLLYKFEDEFVVNLLDPRGRQFVQTNLQFKATSSQSLKTLADNDAPLRDAIIMLLSSKRREDIETPAGKERFKRELMARVDGIVDPKAVSDIYFTKWLLITQ
jgi:flagellar FliL protein